MHVVGVVSRRDMSLWEHWDIGKKDFTRPRHELSFSAMGWQGEKNLICKSNGSGYYRCVQDHFEQLEMHWQDSYGWRHCGFNVYCGPTIWPNNHKGLEDLACYIIRACFSQERMSYILAKDTLDGQAKMIYKSKNGRTSKTFEALDWFAPLVTHIPNKGEQMVRYYGYYSNRSRGLRKKAGIDDQVLALIESAVSSTAFRRNWARLIKKIIKLTCYYAPSTREL